MKVSAICRTATRKNPAQHPRNLSARDDHQIPVDALIRIANGTRQPAGTPARLFVREGRVPALSGMSGVCAARQLQHRSTAENAGNPCSGHLAAPAPSITSRCPNRRWRASNSLSAFPTGHKPDYELDALEASAIAQACRRWKDDLGGAAGTFREGARRDCCAAMRFPLAYRGDYQARGWWISKDPESLQFDGDIAMHLYHHVARHDRVHFKLLRRTSRSACRTACRCWKT